MKTRYKTYRGPQTIRTRISLSPSLHGVSRYLRNQRLSSRVKIWMLFAQSLLPSEHSVCESLERQALVRSLLEDFGRTFPTIEFSLIEEFKFLNAQALLLGSRRQVKLYG